MRAKNLSDSSCIVVFVSWICALLGLSKVHWCFQLKIAFLEIACCYWLVDLTNRKHALGK